MDEKELQLLYNSISSHFDVGDFNAFKSKMQTPEQRKGFYDVVSKNGFDIGDYNTYEQRIAGVKKKELGSLLGGVLSTIGGGAVGGLIGESSKEPTEMINGVAIKTSKGDYQQPEYEVQEQETIDEKDPIKSVNKILLGRTLRFEQPKGESTEQTSLSPMNQELHDEAVKGENIGKILPSNAKKIYEKAKQEIFPTTIDAKRFLYEHQDENNGFNDPNNETVKIAQQKVDQRKAVDDMWNQTHNAESMIAAENSETDFKAIPEAKAGQLIDNWLHKPEVIEKANEDKDFHDQYYNLKGNLYSHYPSYALKKVATDLSQKLEDEKMTGWLFSNPDVKTTDKAVQILVDSGQWSPAEKNIYEFDLKPIIGAGGADKILKTTDIAHSTGRGIYHGFDAIVNSARDITNKVTGGVFQDMGLLETDEDRTKRLQQEQSSQTEVTPKGWKSELRSGGGEFLGFTAPMILGSAVGIPSSVNAIMMFEGGNADRSRELFKDKGEQNLYTLLGTTFDAFFMKLLPTKKAAEGASNLFKKDIVNTIEQLKNKTITESEASKQWVEKLKNYAVSVGKHNVETANVLSAFQLAHNGLDAAFGKRDFNLENELVEGVKNYKTNFLTGTGMSLLAAKGKPSVNTMDIYKEMVDNYDETSSLIREQAKRNPELAAEMQSNLDYLAKIKTELDKKGISDNNQKRYLFEALQEKAKTDVAVETGDPTLDKAHKESLKEHQEVKEKILAGQDHETIVTKKEQEEIDTENDIAALTKKNELFNKEMDLKRKELDGRIPDDKIKIEKLDLQRTEKNDEFKNKVEKLKPLESTTLEEPVFKKLIGDVEKLSRADKHKKFEIDEDGKKVKMSAYRMSERMKSVQSLIGCLTKSI